jgi:hypothetical protein
MLKHLYLSLLFAGGMLVASCQPTPLQISSPYNEQSLTVFYHNEMLFVYLGLHKQLIKVDSNKYLQFDLNEVPLDSRALFVCWANENMDLEILCPKARLVDNNLLNVVVQDDHFTDDRGLPDIMHYHKNGCFELGFDPVGVFPKSHAIIIQN